MNTASHLVYLSLGSNINREDNIRVCLHALADEFGLLSVSSVYESEAVGFRGDPFFNLVVGLRTSCEIEELASTLHKIEDSRGRERSGPRFSGRTLDIDILLVDDLCGVFNGIRLPRPEIKDNAYVLWPLAEVAGSMQLPGDTIILADLWSSYRKETQRLWPIKFCWDGIRLPRIVDL